MPELPEVQTTALGLDRVLRGLTIEDVWTEYDSPYFYGSETIKDPKFFKHFKKTVVGAQILNVTRRAKNVLINLSNNYTILVHMKMTGHLLYGDYNRKDPFNRHIRLIFHLSNKKNLEFCDMRKFAKVTVVPTDTMHETIHLKGVGPEPLEKEFTFSIFKKQLHKRPAGKIKQALIDQTIIAGIGNIYADESLWRAGIHPLSIVRKIPDAQSKELYSAVRTTLSKGIDFGGDSTSDYRDIDGNRGKFQESHNAYRKTGEKCSKKGCSGKIVRIVLGARGTHFCDVHQRLFAK